MKPGVRLEVMRQMRDVLVERAGASSAGVFLASLPYPVKALLALEGSGEIWVNAREFAMFLAAIDLQVGYEESFSVLLGKAFVEKNSAKFLSFVPPNPARFFAFGRTEGTLVLARVFQRQLDLLGDWFFPLELAIDEKISPNRLVCHMGARPTPLPAFCEMIMGVMAALLEMHHAPYVRVVEERCQTDGDPLCSFAIEMESPNPLSFL